MKLHQLSVFLAVCSSGSIHGAARSLGLSQPAVSVSIKQLERELEAPLFERTALGIGLTRYGRAFQVRAAALIADVRRATEEITWLRTEVNARVAIGCPPTSSRILLPRALNCFRERFPAADVTVTDTSYVETMSLLRSGELDFALVQAPQGHMPEEVDIQHLHLTDFPMAICMHQRHPLATKKRLSHFLTAEWMHAGVRTEAIDRGFNDLFVTHGLTPPIRKFNCQSLLSALALLKETNLVSLIALPLIKSEARGDDLIAAELLDPLPKLSVDLVWRTNTPLTTAAEEFMICFKETGQY